MRRANLARVAFFLVMTLASSLRADERRGAAVIAKAGEALAAAKALARAAYREPALRPELNEKTVRIAAGETPSAVYGEEPVPEQQAALARVRQAALDATDPAIGTHLLSAVGRDLGVALVVVVETGESGPAARVLEVEDGHYLPMVLSPKVREPAAEGALPELDWSDAVAVLKGLAPAHQHTHAAPKKPQPAAAPTQPPSKEKGKSEINLLKSPWFWGGLAAVVAVGVTVLVLSQTVLNQPDKVTLDGHIAR